MAHRFILTLGIIAPLLAQEATNRLTIIPSPADVPGQIYFRERRANGQNKIGFRAPDMLPADHEYTLPAAFDTGALCHDGTGALSWGTCAGSGDIDPRWEFDVSGNFLPVTDDLVSIGSISKRVKTLSLNTLQGSTTILGGVVARTTSGGVARVALDATGFTLFDSLGVPKILAFSASGALGAVDGDFTGALSADTVTADSGLTVSGGGATIQRDNNATPEAPTLSLNQIGGGVNDAGAIEFQRTGDPRAKIHADYFDGIVLSTKSGGGALTPRWSVSPDGTLFPWADNTYTLGSVTKRVAGFHSMVGDMYGTLSLNNSALSIKTSGGVQRAGFDVSGFTLYASLGVPTIIAQSASGTFSATNVGATNLSAASVVSNLIPSAAWTLGDNTNRWEAWLSNVSASSVAAAGSITAASGSVSGNWSVGGTLTAGTFAPSSISTATLNATTSATSPVFQVPHPTISAVAAGMTREQMSGFPTRYGGSLLLNYETTIFGSPVILPYFYASPNFGLTVTGTINASATYQINGANGYSGTCATALVISGGIVTNCI